MRKKDAKSYQNRDPSSHSGPSQLVIDSLRVIAKEYGVDGAELQAFLDKHGTPHVILIPTSIFSRKISSLEAICKYLREEAGLSFHDIGEKLSRNDRTIWVTYRNAVRKMPAPLHVDLASRTVPLGVVANRKLSVLESIVSYFRGLDISFSEIGRLLHRDARNIYTVYKRARKKLNE